MSTHQSSLAEKFRLLPAGAEAAQLVDDDELIDEDGYRAFIKCRQAMMRAEMLDLVFKSGKRRAFAYSHLYDIDFDPSEGITLTFSDHVVQLDGVRMLEGYRRILAHRIIQVTEADRPTALLVGEHESVVTSIKVQRLGPEHLG